MKNNYLLSAGLLALSLTIAGCSSSVAKLAVDTKEITTIDATTKIDPKDYLKDIAEDADASYEIKDNVMTITVSKDDKTETFEVPVEVQEPNVSIDDDITIDTYVGYDIEDYIHEDEGVIHTTHFNEEIGELSVTFNKGEWTTTLEKTVEITDSTPEWPKAYSCYDGVQKESYNIWLLDEQRFQSNYDGGDYYGSYSMGDNGYFQYDGYIKVSSSGDYDKFAIHYEYMAGIIDDVCTLIDSARDAVNK